MWLALSRKARDPRFRYAMLFVWKEACAWQKAALQDSLLHCLWRPSGRRWSLNVSDQSPEQPDAVGLCSASRFISLIGGAQVMVVRSGVGQLYRWVWLGFFRLRQLNQEAAPDFQQKPTKLTKVEPGTAVLSRSSFPLRSSVQNPALLGHSGEAPVCMGLVCRFQEFHPRPLSVFPRNEPFLISIGDGQAYISRKFC
jgi:hypothetical protein